MPCHVELRNVTALVRLQYLVRISGFEYDGVKVDALLAQFELFKGVVGVVSLPGDYFLC